MMRRFMPMAASAAVAASLQHRPAFTSLASATTGVAYNASLIASFRFNSTTAPPSTNAKPAAAAAAAGASTSAAEAPKSKPSSSSDSFAEGFLRNRVWASHNSPHGHMQLYLDSGSLLWLVMNRAGSSANALGVEFMADFVHCLDLCDQYFAGKMKDAKSGRVVSPDAVIVTSAKKTFCVGADIDQMYGVTDRSVAVQIPVQGHEVFTRVERAPYPIIAAINGLALGGGLELTLACHYRVASSTAKVGLPECMLGLLPGGGGTVRTQRLAGLVKATEMVLGSGQVAAEKARRAGIVDLVVDGADRWPGEERFLQGVRRWAGASVAGVSKAALLKKATARRRQPTIADKLMERTPLGRSLIARASLKMLNKKTGGKYIAQYKALECLLYSASRSDAQGFQKECENFADLLVSPEAKNLMSLYFLDEGMKKSESKTGIPRASVPPVTQATVIGAGVMGSGIAHYFANKDIPVFLKDLNTAAVEKGKAHVDSLFDAAVKRKRMDPAVGDRKKKLVVGITDNKPLAGLGSTSGVNLIVEAAVEVMSVKKKIVKELEADGALSGPHTIFASNTSSLSITELQSEARHPASVVGMHFFNPVNKMPLVEVIVGEQTSPETAAVIFECALRTGKKPIIVKDRPGFLVNRILGVYMAEAGRLASLYRVHPSTIDAAMKKVFGMPMGPFRLLDEVGLDVACHVAPILENGLNVRGTASEKFPISGDRRFAVDAGIERMMKDGVLGRKNNRGFYKYDDKGRDTALDESLLSKYFPPLSPRGTGGLSDADIIDRCVLLMVNEAAFILSEGTAKSPEDVDIGMVFGTGFPPYRGGLLQHADHVGAAAMVARLEELKAQEERMLTGDDKAKADSSRFTPAPLLVDMAKGNKRFYEKRPLVPYKERKGFPALKY